ncbi:MAG: hypothetical protein PSV13_10385 [Lacunisphaera sp.]|nr:hypothetical protein [Lacunisphaera sp.]
MNTKLIILAITPVFSAGVIVVTANADRILTPSDINSALARHLTGDWGEQYTHDRLVNDEAVKLGERLHSIYRTPRGTVFWVMTEWDRSCTTILLPSDY